MCIRDSLYAVGECSCTGLHGGNRLASNSLIEAVVYADAAAKHSLQVVDQYSYNEDIPEWNDEGTRSPEEMVLITQSMKEVNHAVYKRQGMHAELAKSGDMKNTNWAEYSK